MDLYELLARMRLHEEELEPLEHDVILEMEISERAFARRVILETIDQGFHKELQGNGT
jgi:hypothetical protein